MKAGSPCSASANTTQSGAVSGKKRYSKTDSQQAASQSNTEHTRPASYTRKRSALYSALLRMTSTARDTAD
eukprot:2520-Heterococcus_DN1.PRE.2